MDEFHLLEFLSANGVAESAFYYIGVGLFGGIIGWAIGQRRERGAAGFWVGFVLGPIGWVIACFLEDGRPKCRQCLGSVPRGAVRCMHCGQPLWTVPANPLTENPFKK